MTVAWVTERYRRFATEEAPGRSDLYASWADRVATDERVATLIAGFPDQRRQPALVFAVSRLLGASEGGAEEWAEFVLSHAEQMASAVRTRSVQTNEPLRCAPLLLALSRIDGPIALVELGASAGLCLYPDRYAYHYRGDTETQLHPAGGSTVLLESQVRGRLPWLDLPEVVWRSGADLHPLDARAPEDRAWLTSLVWPGETGRAERIEAALDIAAADPPALLTGDALGALDDLLARVPRWTTPVVTTPGVLPHMPRVAREALVDRIRSLPVRWITLDAPGLHSGFVTGGDQITRGFGLALDGEVIAQADPLGGWVEPFRS